MNVVNSTLAQVETIVRRALSEDIGDGDVTTQCTVPSDARLNGQFMAKEPGVVAGLEVVGLTFSTLDERVQFAPLVADGERVEAGCVIGTVSGPGQALLSGERAALNFLLLTISVAVSGLTSGDRLPSTVYMLWEKSRARGSTELTGWEVPPCWRG
jgi:nicotinate-nucleotide pyrophosphorylase